MDSEKLKVLKLFLGSSYKVSEENLFFCPKCKHHKKKLSVNIAKDKFKCWVCDYRGASISRLVRRWGDQKHIEMWSRFDTRIKVSSLRDAILGRKEEDIQEEQKISLPENFRSLIRKNYTIIDKMAVNYLAKRGISQKQIIKYKIGYCPTGEYQNRIIVPSFDVDGDINYFVGRTYEDDWRKYKNPAVSKDIIFNELLVDWDYPVTLVEGAFDSMMADNSIALLGSTLNKKSSIFKKILSKEPILYVALDRDAEKKSLKIIKEFIAYGLEVYKVDTSSAEDVSEMGADNFNQAKLYKSSQMNYNNILRQALNNI